MKTPQQLLAAAKALPLRSNLEDHYETVATLRSKGLTWREIAEWLGENGIETDHAKVFRMFSRRESERSFTVPSAEQYQQALESLRRKDKLNGSALAMLRLHHSAHNRTVTYTALAQAGATASAPPGAEAGSPNHRAANSTYGKLGRMIGEAIDANFRFAPADDKGTPFYSSAIGAPNPWKPDGGHFQLVMHHELAKALDRLGWANDLPKE
jgi:hypothetical protein